MSRKARIEEIKRDMPLVITFRPGKRWVKSKTKPDAFTELVNHIADKYPRGPIPPMNLLVRELMVIGILSMRATGQNDQVKQKNPKTVRRSHRAV